MTSADAVLKDLTALWASLDKAGERAEHGVLRACAMTLLVFDEESRDPAQIGEIVARVMQEHPNRAILVRLCGDAGASPQHKVLAQCWLPFGRREQICCEQIEVTVGTRKLGEMAPLLGALAAPDLPLVAWYRVPQALEALAPELLRPSRVIVDGADLGPPAAALAKLEKLAGRGSPLADLSWTRLTRWREVVAQVFEDPVARGLLADLREVRVFYSGPSEPPLAAYYLGGWVNAMLDRLIPVRFEVGLEGIALECGDREVSVRRVEGSEAVLIKMGATLDCAMCQRRADVELLREELGIAGRDMIYERSLAAALRIAPAGRR